MTTRRNSSALKPLILAVLGLAIACTVVLPSRICIQSANASEALSPEAGLDVWRKNLPDEMSELVDALIALELDREILERTEELVAKCGPEVQLVQARRLVEMDIIAVDHARRTLRLWPLTDDEIRRLEHDVLMRVSAERTR